MCLLIQYFQINFGYAETTTVTALHLLQEFITLDL